MDSAFQSFDAAKCSEIIVNTFGIVILAAGQGTRLKLNVPKPLAPIVGRKLIDFPLQAADAFLQENNRQGHVALVLGHGKELIEQHVQQNWKKLSCYTAHQKEQKGTADALRAYFNDVAQAKEATYT